MGKKSGSGSGMKNSDHIFESLETIFWVKILKLFDADQGWKKFGSGINIPDPEHCIYAYISQGLPAKSRVCLCGHRFLCGVGWKLEGL
jgi:hypothetical protein